MLRGCPTLKCGSRFHCVIPNLRQQSRRTFCRDWVASEIAVHEDSEFVKACLSSKSYCSFGFPLPVLVELTRIHEVHSFSGPSVSLFLQDPTFLGSNMKVSCAHICFVLHLLFFRIGLFLQSITNLSCNVSRGVLTVLVSALHPDSWMIPGGATIMSTTYTPSLSRSQSMPFVILFSMYDPDVSNTTLFPFLTSARLTEAPC